MLPLVIILLAILRCVVQFIVGRWFLDSRGQAPYYEICASSKQSDSQINPLLSGVDLFFQPINLHLVVTIFVWTKDLGNPRTNLRTDYESN